MPEPVSKDMNSLSDYKVLITFEHTVCVGFKLKYQISPSPVFNVKHVNLARKHPTGRHDVIGPLDSDPGASDMSSLAVSIASKGPITRAFPVVGVRGIDPCAHDQVLRPLVVEFHQTSIFECPGQERTIRPSAVLPLASLGTKYPCRNEI